MVVPNSDVLEEIQAEEDNNLLIKIRHERVTKLFLFAVAMANLYSFLSLLEKTMELHFAANLLTLRLNQPEEGFTDQFSFRATIFSFWIALVGFLFIHFPHYYMAGVVALASVFESVMCWTCIQEYFHENRKLLNRSNLPLPANERTGLFHLSMQILDIAIGLILGATGIEKKGDREFRLYQDQRKEAKMEVIISACTAIVALVTHIYILCKYSPYFANFNLEKWMEGNDNDEEPEPTTNNDLNSPSNMQSGEPERKDAGEESAESCSMSDQ